MIPVIINYCQWDVDIHFKDYIFNLNELQVLPNEAKPIDDWTTPAKALNNIAGGIRTVLSSIKNTREKELIIVEENEIPPTYANEATTEINETQIAEHKEVVEEEKNEIPPTYRNDATTETNETQIAEQKENLFWESAINTNSFLAYEQYVENYPDGRFKDEAQNRINELVEKRKKKRKVKMWIVIVSAVVLLIFIIKFTSSPHVNIILPKDLIINKWRLIKIYAPGKDSMPVTIPTTKELIFEFTKDGRFFVSGDAVTSSSGTASYSISADGKMLTVTGSAKPGTSVINELSRTKLVMTEDNVQWTFIPK